MARCTMNCICPFASVSVDRPGWFRRFTTRLAISRLCRATERVAQAHGVKVSGITWFGAYEIHPKYMVVLIRVETDRDKQKLNQDVAFQTALRAQLAAVSYPPEGRDGVAFDVESQETVDREWDGDWWQRIK